jgi:hypothetical protein
VHAHVGADGWEGMVGTVTVAPGGGDETPGSGVDYTEYRVNTDGATGEWVRRDNAAAASPFLTQLNVSAPGSHVVEYRSADKAGNVEATKSVAFSIAGGGTSVDKDAEVVADVPMVMALTLGGPVAFESLVPGVAKDYTASTTATVTSSAPSTTLTVADRSATATGHLVNGALALPQALQVGAGGPFAPLGGSGSPTLLKSWAGPLAGEPLTVQFKQPVAANDKLLAGRYGKTVTFTLSTTTP